MEDIMTLGPQKDPKVRRKYNFVHHEFWKGYCELWVSCCRCFYNSISNVKFLGNPLFQKSQFHVI